MTTTANPPSPAPSITIRPVRLSDAPGLCATCWPDRPLEAVTELMRRAERLAGQRRGLGVVAEIDGQPGAFGMLTLWPRVGEISDLIVDAAHRDCGIGTRIIQHLASAARAFDIETLEIGAALSNPRAVALYRRLGFVDGRTLQLELGGEPEPVLYLYQRLRRRP